MEKDKKISALLGMRQEEMAMLLRVNKSQWSMYEIGQRDLPLNAQLKLTEMLAFVQQSDNEAVNPFLDLEGQNVKTIKVVENLKLVNQHQFLIAKRKLQFAEKKYNAAVIALRFIAFLQTNDQQFATDQNSLLGVIQSRALRQISKNGLHVQVKHRIKLQVLQEEERVLNGMG